MSKLLHPPLTLGVMKLWTKEIQQKRESVIQDRNKQKDETSNEAFTLDGSIQHEDIEAKSIPISATFPYHEMAQAVSLEYDLNEKQKEVYWLFINNALKRLSGEKTRQIISHMGGMAGCGKSRVIKAIKTFHDRAGIHRSLKIASPTGTSAALVEGSTIHSLAQIMPSKYKNKKSNSSPKLEETWQDVTLLICDECSMIGCNLLALLSQAITKGKHCDSSIPFGDIDVLLTGMVMENLINLCNVLKNRNKVCKSTAKNKSPGNDGLPAEFYKVFWLKIKPFLVAAVRKSFEEGKLSISQRQGLITLIPKKR